MATTANHPDGSFVGASATEPDEDIAAIAKQISDHAEVIYQTWKARGLAPNEILTCHNSLNAADQFGSVLTPTGKSANSRMDFLYNNRRQAASAAATNLEQIVNKFVVEDKARLAARQKSDAPGVPSTARNYPSSIQYALQKFERRCPDVVNNPVKFASPRSPTNSATVFAKSASPTDEKCFPERFVPTSNAPQMTKPDDVDGTSTWPLKATKEADKGKYSTMPSKMEKRSCQTDEFLDEVAKEEERLINALKTGMVITANDTKASTPTVTKTLPDEARKHEKFVNKIKTLDKDAKKTEDAVLSTKRPRRSATDTNDSSSRPNVRMNANSSNTTNGIANTANPVRPFLTRGSVAERVMMFEKCPTEILEKRTKANNANSASWKNLASDVHSKIQVSGTTRR